jgi:hypothetical protein
LSFSYPPRNAAQKKQKVAPATFECQGCSVYIYEGSSEKNLNKVVEQFPDKKVIAGKIYMDHIEPVVDPDEGYNGWDSFIERLFCDEEGFQLLCKECHDEKTAQERNK